MKRPLLLLILSVMSVAAILAVTNFSPTSVATSQAEKNVQHLASNGRKPLKKPGKRPSDFFYVQRAYPFDSIPVQEYRQAVTSAQAKAAAFKASRQAGLASTNWVQAGPTNIPGRIIDFAVDKTNLAVVYAASAAGGIFKSTDTGMTWVPVFNDQGNLSMGAIAMHPTNPNILIAGTGEASPGFDSYEGAGMFKTTNGGASWIPIGSPDLYRIGTIAYDPQRPETLFAAVGGKHFGGGNPDRGIYRSLNGGTSWTKVLYVSDTTAAIDVLALSNGVVIGAMWERVRYVDKPTRLGGTTTGIYRSTNNGTSWTLLGVGNGLPGPSSTAGKISLTSNASGQIVYALYATNNGDFMGLYKSTNFGQNWTAMPSGTLAGNGNVFSAWGGGWYFGGVFCAPGDSNQVWVRGFNLMTSIDGGNSFGLIDDSYHPDQHGMWIDPNNSDVIYAGNDGGVIFTTNGGAAWTQRYNQPSTQFYAVTMDPQNPERIYGGAQDNGTMRTVSGDIFDYEPIFGGDGFTPIVDYTDPNIIYALYQNGGLVKTTDGTASWNFIGIGGETFAWSTPVVMDPNNHLVLYMGSRRMHKTTNGGGSWTVISPQLSGGPYTRSSFGVITTISVSKVNPQVIFAGTDDGRVWRTQNAGANWTLINTGLPNRWVTRVVADPRHDNIVYVTLSGYWHGAEAVSHVFRSTDFGTTWTAIDGDLPNAPVNDIIPDPADSSWLWVANDVGVYFSDNLGSTWSLAAPGMPIVAVADIDLHHPTRKLIAGTHGQSIFSVTVPGASCCQGTTGNVDNDPSDMVDISDLQAMIDYLFFSGSLSGCAEEQNVDVTGTVDISDLQGLIDYLFFGAVLPSCP